ncbi:hypothetical protein CRENPOLYSF2_3030023 [Crenothrix polyspora]|uniref:DUF2281 domain-containing protein n=1 Tax=Crenothrix polyspora TaxID=360316 RepID=A0A1R4HAW7_9GAMM|nr:DUF2281 domain-containing protein [Crenothrix polyspora]SJM93010.1 hypothetical protein CRENPOLYSF2_3030023 [Crenothrix polyspora]
MNATQLLNDIEQLPTEAQHQIEDFIAFIKSRYQSTNKTKLSDEEFVGMWSDRPEITKGDKEIDPAELFSIWDGQPRDLSNIRKVAWQRSELE